MKRSVSLHAGCLLYVLVTGASAVQAGQYNVEQEIGGPLSALDETSARTALVRYSEGRILARAPEQARVELLQTIVNASPEGSAVRRRAELLLESAKSGRWQ